MLEATSWLLSITNITLVVFFTTQFGRSNSLQLDFFLVNECNVYTLAHKCNSELWMFHSLGIYIRHGVSISVWEL